MPIVHFPPELFDEKPWLGVVLGVVCMAVFAGIGYSTAIDSLKYAKQKVPETLDLSQANLDLSPTRRWVTLTNFQLDCQTFIQTERTEVPDVWILGRVANTFTVISDPSGGSLMIVKFDGDVPCSAVQSGPLIGVLTDTKDLMYGGVPEKFGKTTRPVLYVGQGIKQSALLLILSVVLIILGFYIVVLSSKKWAERFGKRAKRPAGFLRVRQVRFL